MEKKQKLEQESEQLTEKIGEAREENRALLESYRPSSPPNPPLLIFNCRFFHILLIKIFFLQNA